MVNCCFIFVLALHRQTVFPHNLIAYKDFNLVFSVFSANLSEILFLDDVLIICPHPMIFNLWLTWAKIWFHHDTIFFTSMWCWSFVYFDNNTIKILVLYWKHNHLCILIVSCILEVQAGVNITQQSKFRSWDMEQ
mgnify:CR=1 FL=1